MLVGFFRRASDARRAIESLHSHGFGPDQIGAAFREAELPHPSDPGTRPDRDSATWFNQLRQTYQGKGMEPARAEWSPGEFASSLSRLQIPPERARSLAQGLAPGHAIVTVNAGSRMQEAVSLLEQNGAILRQADHAQPAAPGEPTQEAIVASTPFAPPQSTKPGHIQLFGEVLRVHKDKISAGDVRVRKESVTELKTVEVPVTREHLVVEHTDGKGNIEKENAIRIPLSEEQVRIDKETVLREEYKVGKREVTRDGSVTDQVRRERLLIDDAKVDEADESKRE